jgi:large subunit ribosomal protein L35
MARRKHKTNKAAAKRLRMTAGGKIKHAAAGRGHLLGEKSRKRKRHLRKGGFVSPSDYKRIVNMLPK